jgi:hypothetical protein
VLFGNENFYHRVKEIILNYFLSNKQEILDLIGPELKNGDDREWEAFAEEYIAHVSTEGVC